MRAPALLASLAITLAGLLLPPAPLAAEAPLKLRWQDLIPPDGDLGIVPTIGFQADPVLHGAFGPSPGDDALADDGALPDTEEDGLAAEDVPEAEADGAVAGPAEAAPPEAEGMRPGGGFGAGAPQGEEKTLAETRPEDEATAMEVETTLRSTVTTTLVDPYQEMMDRLMTQTAVRRDLDGKRIRMPGFIVPLNLEDVRVTEFYLVPYAGACWHVPPPPPNQIIYVAMPEGLDLPDMYAPVWVEGTLQTKPGEIGIAEVGYQMVDPKVEVYRF